MFPSLSLLLPYKSFCLLSAHSSLCNIKSLPSPLIIQLYSRSLVDMAEVMRPEKLDITNDTSSLASPELLHVLAVDDSMVDRKFIERLLRVSSCKGNWFFFVFGLFLSLRI